MEHEDELRIREKIKALDNVPLSWDKEIVWSSIRFGVRPSRRIFVYYAAASIALAAALIFYSIERTHQKELELQLTELELAIRQTHQDSKRELASADTVVTRCPEIRQVAESKTSGARHQNATTKIAVVQQPNESVVALNLVEEKEVVVTEPIHADSAQVLKPSISQPEPEKRAVVLGRSIAQSPDPTSTKRGRLQLRIFRGDDELTAPPSGIPVTTLASINNN